ncbi:hypothetical protein Hte_008335 [Hypoxylon texense]
MTQTGPGRKPSAHGSFSVLYDLVLQAQKNVAKVFVLFWLFTVDDAATFVAPNTIFGLCSALSAPVLVAPQDDITSIFLRLPHVVFFNWSNLLIFDLANQRLPESAREDALNKPWRPVPSGLMTSAQVRRAMLFCIPAVLAVNYVSGVGAETSLLLVLTWLYNDLMGGDENWIVRNAIIASAFWMYNTGSTKVACSSLHGQTALITEKGALWTTIISGVIFTTMHVQDLKDQEGDCARGRRLAPLVLGDLTARWTIAVPEDLGALGFMDSSTLYATSRTPPHTHLISCDRDISAGGESSQ